MCTYCIHMCVCRYVYVHIVYRYTYILQVSCFNIIFNFNKNIFFVSDCSASLSPGRSFSSCCECGLPSSCGARLLVATASLAVERGLQGVRLQKQRDSGCFPAACGIFVDQGLNRCALRCKVILKHWSATGRPCMYYTCIPAYILMWIFMLHVCARVLHVYILHVFVYMQRWTSGQKRTKLSKCRNK